MRRQFYLLNLITILTAGLATAACGIADGIYPKDFYNLVVPPRDYTLSAKHVITISGDTS